MVCLCLAGVLLLLPALQAASYKRTLRIESEPMGAEVTDATGAVRGRTPFEVKEHRISDEAPLVLTFTLADHESVTRRLTQEEVRGYARSSRDVMVVRADLERLVQRVSVRFEAAPGTRFRVDGNEVSSDTTLVFRRGTSKEPWGSLSLRAERENHLPEVRMVRFEESSAWRAGADGRKVLTLAPVEVARERELEVSVNVAATTVTVSGGEVQVAGPGQPARLRLRFTRTDALQPWSTNTVVVAKEGYEFRPPAPAPASAEVTTNLTWEAVEACGGRLDLPYFQPVRFVPVPWRRVRVDRGQVTLEVTNVLSAVTPEGTVNAYHLSLDEDELLIADRFGVVAVPEEKGKPAVAVLAVAKRAVRDGRPAETVGSEIIMVFPPPARGVQRLTSIGEQHGVFSVHPCITRDGQWVFFASNRNDDQYRIFRVSGKGLAGISDVSPPQPGTHLEPAVWTDKEGEPRLAFTLYPVNAAAGAQPKIMVQGRDRVFTEVCKGHSPAWSADGTRIAYVTPRGRIAILDTLTGRDVVQLEEGNAPAWLPGDHRQLVFARPNARSIGLAVINSDGSGQPAIPVTDSSVYTFPAVSGDAQTTFIYFLSNRQAQRIGDESWGLYYIEWNF